MNWKDAVGKLAPTIGTLLGGPVGGMAAQALTSALGLSPDADEQQIEKALQGATPEQILAIKKADADLKIRLKELDIRPEEIAFEDRSSARDREIKAGDSLTPRILSAVVVIGFFSVLAAVLHYGIEQQNQVVLLLIGTLTAALTQVFNYYFGSSAGSKQKEQQIAKMKNGTGPIWR